MFNLIIFNRKMLQMYVVALYIFSLHFDIRASERSSQTQVALFKGVVKLHSFVFSLDIVILLSGCPNFVQKVGPECST